MRGQLGLPKTHFVDAACVGASTPEHLAVEGVVVLTISAVGHGTRQMCGTNKAGFPIRQRSRKKRHFGFQTGDMVRAVVPVGKRQGTHEGRVLVRASGSFDIVTAHGREQGISHRYCQILAHVDGYSYTKGDGASSPALKKPDSYPHFTNGGRRSALKRMDTAEVIDRFAINCKKGSLAKRFHHFTLLNVGKRQA